MGPVLMPPPEYDFPFPGKTIVHSMSSAEVRARWSGERQPLGRHIEAFSYLLDPQTCVHVMPNDVSPVYLEYLKRHENGHCNGWPEDHPGATLP